MSGICLSQRIEAGADLESRSVEELQFTEVAVISVQTPEIDS